MDEEQDGHVEELDALGVLQEPNRRKLYRHVVAAGCDVARDDAAEAVGVPRTLAAFHLDKLAEAGLLEVSFRRRSGRSGPGAGRPAKFYRAVRDEVGTSVPPRAYETAARLLAETVEETNTGATLQRRARTFGAVIGREIRAELDAAGVPEGDPLLEQALTRRGYEPAPDGDVLRLRNCPFHRLVQDYMPLVCPMNLALVQGLLDGLGVPGTASEDTAAGHCCVAISRTPDTPSETF